MDHQIKQRRWEVARLTQPCHPCLQPWFQLSTATLHQRMGKDSLASR
jgi:hypothetical protein